MPRDLKILIICSFLNIACTTKVSEWVLLNAPANRYTLVFFYDRQIDESTRNQNALIGREIKPANIDFRSIEKKGITHPYYALYYGSRLFSRYTNPGELTGLTISPLRKNIAAEIMSGKLCVLTYLTTGDQEKDEKGRTIIKKTLSASPYKDIITFTELNRNSSNEAHLVSMLLNVEDDLKTIDEPMLFGIFGKFKALEPLVSRGISEENITLMINFLTADCSCLIKDNLPGTDILCTEKWDNPSAALVNRILDENPYLIHH